MRRYELTDSGYTQKRDTLMSLSITRPVGQPEFALVAFPQKSLSWANRDYLAALDLGHDLSREIFLLLFDAFAYFHTRELQHLGIGIFQ